MKNLIALFILSTFLFFASCSKEALIQSETEAITSSEIMIKIAPISNIPIQEVETSHAEGTHINVNVDSYSTTSTEIIVDFTSSHDFGDSVLESTQTLEFTDEGLNTVTLTFGVNSYTGEDGTLDVSLAIGGNDLTGLSIKTAQIIVDEIIIN